jgi:hypothetical protein
VDFVFPSMYGIGGALLALVSDLRFWFSNDWLLTDLFSCMRTESLLALELGVFGSLIVRSHIAS